MPPLHEQSRAEDAGTGSMLTETSFFSTESKVLQEPSGHRGSPALVKAHVISILSSVCMWVRVRGGKIVSNLS